jgi:hypothetical protein
MILRYWYDDPKSSSTSSNFSGTGKIGAIKETNFRSPFYKE